MIAEEARRQVAGRTTQGVVPGVGWRPSRVATFSVGSPAARRAG